MRRKRRYRTRVFNLLDSQGDTHDLVGFAFILQPTRDPVAWDALVHYSTITANVVQKQLLIEWLGKHPRPEAARW